MGVMFSPPVLHSGPSLSAIVMFSDSQLVFGFDDILTILFTFLLVPSSAIVPSTLVEYLSFDVFVLELCGFSYYWCCFTGSVTVSEQ